MTTRTEEIAAEGPYTVRYDNGRYVIDGPTPTVGFWALEEWDAQNHADDLNAAYKQGQQDRWIPLTERLPDSTEAGEKEQNLVNVLLKWKSGMSKVVLAARVSCREDDQPLWSWVDENGDDDPFDHELATHWVPLPPNPEQR